MWNPQVEPPHRPITVIGWGRVALRGGVLATLTFGGLAVLLVVRLFERPVYGLHRPVTPYITLAVCRCAFVVLGIGFSTRGTPMAHRGGVVANHSSWLDIFALNARKRVYFVSKSEVRRWPAIGWLARATGTVFIDRNPRDAKKQQLIFESRLLAGHKLLFFPEGTSTDGLRVLPFKTPLFQAFFDKDLRHEMHIQPVTLNYLAPSGEDARFYGWWGDMDFAPHLLLIMAAPRQGRVEIVYHPPVKVDAFKDRKSLAAHLESQVRSGLEVRGSFS